jgi:hypothetical protein
MGKATRKQNGAGLPGSVNQQKRAIQTRIQAIKRSIGKTRKLRKSRKH